METIESLNDFAIDLALACASQTTPSAESQEAFWRTMDAVQSFQGLIRQEAYFESQRAIMAANPPRHRF